MNFAALRSMLEVGAARRGRLPIAGKVSRSYLLIIAVAVVVFVVVGTQLVGRLILSEAQSSVSNALNTAREVLSGRLDDVHDVVRLTADRFVLKDALQSGKV